MTPTDPTLSGTESVATGPVQIGMDIGGSKTAAVAISASGEIEASLSVPTLGGIDGVLDTAELVLASLAERTGRSVAEFTALGVGVPGQVDRVAGVVRHAYNIGINELDLGARLSERTGIPVSVENDVTAAAIGAAHLMHLDGVVAYLNLGTGLAAGFVIDGRPLRGATGGAGEIGHLPVDRRQRPCPCGQLGCLETVASGSALKTYWPAGGEHPGRELLGAVEAGDVEARSALDHLVDGAASAIRILGLTLDPNTVVIGGGLRFLGDPLLHGIRDTLARWEHESPFFGQLVMSRRLQVLPADSPAAATGAAIASGS